MKETILRLIISIIRQGGSIVMLGIFKHLANILLDEATENDNIQGFFRKIGKELGKTIPGDTVEDNIDTAIECFQEGLKESYKNNGE